jgi:thiol peroxidase
VEKFGTMAQTKLGDLVVHTAGSLPGKGTVAPGFVLTGVNLRDVELRQFEGKNVILNIYPSVDTRTCAMSTREFNRRASSVADTVVICISKDLPFAFRRFCGAEGIDKVLTASDFRSRGFASDYGVELIDGAFAGLFARAIVVIDKVGRIKHTELVPSIDDEPNYDSAIAALE